MLEHPRAGDGAVFGDVAHQKDGGAALLGVGAESATAASRTWLTLPGADEKLVAVERLDGVDHDERGAVLVERLEDGLELGLGEHVDGARVAADPLGAHA